jgi:hypothetical protein
MEMFNIKITEQDDGNIKMIQGGSGWQEDDVIVVSKYQIPALIDALRTFQEKA